MVDNDIRFAPPTLAAQFTARTFQQLSLIQKF